MATEILVMRGEFVKIQSADAILMKEYSGDKLLLCDKPQIIYETSDLLLNEYMKIHFCEDDNRRNISMRLVRVEKIEQLFSEIAICKEETYVFSGEIQEKDGNVMIGEDTLYDIIWNKSPLKSTNSGYLYIEMYIDNIGE